MNEAKKHESPHAAIKMADKYLLTTWHWPLLVRTGLRNWKTKTVPVGRSLMRFPTPVRVACVRVFFEVVGDGVLDFDDIFFL